MTQTHTNTTRTLVLRVNELFHDLENADYAQVHPEIFEREKTRWQRLLRKYLPITTAPRTSLDMGTGTGFVSELLLPHLHEQDTLICTDISQAMLDVCERTLRTIQPHISYRFLKTTDEYLPLPDASVDIVTLNSVLHHIPSWTIFLDEIMRVLKPGGLLFIGHEPNAALFQNSFLLKQANIVHNATPRRIAAKILKGLGMYDQIIKKKKQDARLEAINAQLMQERLITAPLTEAELSGLIDIHSPTAGALHMDRGFSASLLLDQWKDRMGVCTIETYNHLLKMSAATPLHKAYDRLLRTMFPRSGSIFFLVARRHH